MSQKIAVHDSLQIYSYELSKPEGECFAPEFCPELTPSQMLELGVFGGHYFENEHDEFPSTWFRRAKLCDTHDAQANFFGVDASQSREVWLKKGWINEQDPRGWFQWYCRYYLGRRSDDDVRQIKRWKNMRRHLAQIKSHCYERDLFCRPRQRQALLHWAYDTRKV